jgi:hypothetical protein
MAGYSALAGFMAANPEAAIVKRFQSLSMENILLLQAELIDIEIQYRDAVKANDASSDPERSKFSRDWYLMSAANDDSGASEQWKLMLRFRDKSREFSKSSFSLGAEDSTLTWKYLDEAILQYHQMSTLPMPSRETHDAFLEWKSRPTMGNVYLFGRDRHVWNERDDLVVIRAVPVDSALTRWFRRRVPTVIRVFQKCYPVCKSSAVKISLKFERPRGKFIVKTLVPTPHHIPKSSSTKRQPSSVLSLHPYYPLRLFQFCMLSMVWDRDLC